ncbi:MAG TPA: low affinity iron permease family protein [Actinomycetes bacterium]
MSDRIGREHPRGSRAVHRLQEWSARTFATGLAAALSVCVLISATLTRRGDALLVWFEAVASGVTLVMVFVLQHTQTRQQVALQLKLDELLRALPEADSRLIRLESAPPAEMAVIADVEGTGRPGSS